MKYKIDIYNSPYKESKSSLQLTTNRMPCTNHHFNSDLDMIQKEWYCRKCSRGFHSFVEGFIELNTDTMQNFEDLKRNSRTLRSTRPKFINSIRSLLSLVDTFRYVLPGRGSYNGGILNANYFREIKKIKGMKFPLIKTDDVVLNNFISDTAIQKKQYLTFEDLRQLNLICEDEKYQRYDVFFRSMSMHVDDIEFLEDKYKTKYNLDFPRFKERGELSIQEYIDNNNINLRETCFDRDGYVFEAKYTEDIAILVNYLSFIYCQKCFSKNYFECISEKMYILSSCVSIIFNKLCIPRCIEILHSDKFAKFKQTISMKLEEIKKDWGHEPFSYTWLGINRYYEKLGIVPYILRQAGVDDDHYRYRAWTYFTDSICGHYMASHGWCAEALQEAIDDGGIIDA
jgi:hypothetical protein